MFSVDDGHVDVVPEHSPPDAFSRYLELKRSHEVVGMTTFPNAVLLRGPRTVLVDPGMLLQNQPIVRSLERLGVDPAQIDLLALTHAHLDHAGACWDLDLPVAVHELERGDPAWSAVSGILAEREVRWLSGDGGELVEGIRWLRTPGHTAGSVCYLAETPAGLAALVGDTVGPRREPFDEMRAPHDAAGEQALAAWRTIRSARPALIVAGHLPPFAP